MDWCGLHHIHLHRGDGDVRGDYVHDRDHNMSRLHYVRGGDARCPSSMTVRHHFLLEVWWTWKVVF